MEKGKKMAVADLTELTDKSKKKVDQKIPKQKAPLFLGALFVNLRLKLSR
ncbi:hypothetical protein QUB68_26655 [Microcoleus sp. A006_D1]